MTWSGGGSNSQPLDLQSRMLLLDHGPPVSVFVESSATGHRLELATDADQCGASLVFSGG